MNKFILFLVLIIGMSLGGIITYYNTTELDNLFRKEPELVVTVEQQDKIDSYNAGYRSGSMNTLAVLVECEDVTDRIVLDYYWFVSGRLEALGELDENPYPCEEGI